MGAGGAQLMLLTYTPLKKGFHVNIATLKDPETDTLKYLNVVRHIVGG